VKTRRVLLLCGPLSSLLYLTAIDVVAPLIHPGYHSYDSQMVSELMAAGAPTRPLLVALFVPYNLLVLAFAAGVAASAGGRRSVRACAAALAGYAIISTCGLLLFQMDLRGTVDSRRDVPHVVATLVMSLFLMASIASGAHLAGRCFRLYSFATLAVLLVFGAAAGWLARPMPGPTPWIGLAERVNIYATMAWIASLPLALWWVPQR
jgi:hypothetical protein